MHAGPSGRIAGCSHFSRQHHRAAATYVGGAPKRASGSTWFGRAFTVGICSGFLCLGGYVAPPRQVGGRAPRDALGRRPSADPRRWRLAGGPVAGADFAVFPPAAI
jgi:hypothetical protein